MIGLKRRRRRSAAGAAAFDPATLALTGWWRASFASSPWAGVASAGASGSRAITEATNPPAVGSALNSLNPADFDGTNDQLSSALSLDDFANAGAWSAWCLFNADTAAADAGAGARQNNPQLITDSQGYMGLGFSSAGVHVFGFEASQKELAIATGTAGWHLAQAKHDGVDLKLRVDSSAWSTIACGSLGSLTGTMKFGTNYNAAAFLDGRIADMGLADSALSDGNFDSIKSYVNSRYALSL